MSSIGIKLINWDDEEICRLFDDCDGYIGLDFSERNGGIIILSPDEVDELLDALKELRRADTQRSLKQLEKRYGTQAPISIRDYWTSHGEDNS